MSRIQDNVRRADDAAESVGLAATYISARTGDVGIQNDPFARWTIEQGEAIAEAFGVPRGETRIDYFPPTDCHKGFCYVEGDSTDGIKINVCCSYVPEAPPVLAEATTKICTFCRTRDEDRSVCTECEAVTCARQACQYSHWDACQDAKHNAQVQR